MCLYALSAFVLLSFFLLSQQSHAHALVTLAHDRRCCIPLTFSLSVSFSSHHFTLSLSFCLAICLVAISSLQSHLFLKMAIGSQILTHESFQFWLRLQVDGGERKNDDNGVVSNWNSILKECLRWKIGLFISSETNLIFFRNKNFFSPDSES